MSSYYIYADHFFFPSFTEGPGYLAIADGKFGNFQKEKPTGEIKDYSGRWIAPGLVDTHIHGLLGHDVMDADLDGLKKIAEGLLACGVTSWLPTTLTASVESLNEVSRLIGEHAAEVDGAKIQGIFFEGPFFTEKHKGAQNPEYFMDPDVEIFDHWQKLAHGLIKKIAIAPERDHVIPFIRALDKEGVTVALGHSDASFEQAKAAVEAGADVFVHTYNGMSGLNHRKPGMAGAAMSLKEVYAELICDGHHVHPQAAEILIELKGEDHLVLITDCMRAGHMPDGEYTLGDFPVIVKDGAARLKEDESALAGSILELKDAVRNLVAWDLVRPDEAIRMASLTPARSVGIADKCGSLLPDHAADFLVLTPTLELEETYLDGISRFQK